jgi:DNA-binding MarR family transcriptional regulator
LAVLTGLTTGAVTGLIDRFEKKGLVKREFAADDRRKVMIVPDIPKIRTLLEPLYRDFRSRSEALIGSFPDEAITVLESYFLQAIALTEETTHQLINSEQ